jgi:hypothetical protein
VGKRNYRYFLGFVFVTQANVLWVMVWCIVEMILRITSSTRTGVDALINDVLAVPFRYPLVIIPTFSFAFMFFTQFFVHEILFHFLDYSLLSSFCIVLSF